MTASMKANYTEGKKKPKYFTGGKPKDFELTTENGGMNGVMSETGKTYSLVFVNGSKFCQKGMREVAEHMLELADILEGKLVA